MVTSYLLNQDKQNIDINMGIQFEGEARIIDLPLLLLVVTKVIPRYWEITVQVKQWRDFNRESTVILPKASSLVLIHCTAWNSANWGLINGVLGGGSEVGRDLCRALDQDGTTDPHCTSFFIVWLRLISYHHGELYGLYCLHNSRVHLNKSRSNLFSESYIH